LQQLVDIRQAIEAGWREIDEAECVSSGKIARADLPVAIPATPKRVIEAIP
jgi:hypothetical protein